jgi:hypothetical protein
MRPRTAGSIASVDAVSHGFGTGGAVPSGTQRGAGTVTGGMLPALAYVSQAQTWGSVPAAPRSDAIDVTASNLAAVTVDPARAHVDCRASLEVKTDGPVQITLAGCRRTVTAGP